MLANVPLYQADALSKALCLRSGLDEMLAESLFSKRKDPRMLLCRLVREPGKLLDAMIECSVMLSSPKANEYFIPGSDSSSAWSFYVNSEKEQLETCRFMSLTEELGLTWDTRLIADEVAQVPVNWVTGSATGPASARYDLSLKSIASGSSLLNVLVDRDNSLIQCFITGFAAGHLYYKMTFEHKCTTWEGNVKRSTFARLLRNGPECPSCTAARYVRSLYPGAHRLISLIKSGATDVNDAIVVIKGRLNVTFALNNNHLLTSNTRPNAHLFL
ncbi:hypothetical protein MMC17_009541 [Xylographa soralifera]|nr:hypothetical protein [Xylographa soralifera]